MSTEYCLNFDCSCVFNNNGKCQDWDKEFGCTNTTYDEGEFLRASASYNMARMDELQEQNRKLRKQIKALQKSKNRGR